MFDHVKYVHDWMTFACHVCDIVYYKVMMISLFVKCNSETWMFNVSYGESWTRSWCWRIVFLIKISKVSWLITFKLIGTQCKSCMVVGVQVNQWSIGSEHIISITFNLWINTQNNKSNQRCVNNTQPCAWIQECHLLGRSRCLFCSYSMLVVFLEGCRCIRASRVKE
jgi:hypothetical protein